MTPTSDKPRRRGAPPRKPGEIREAAPLAAREKAFAIYKASNGKATGSRIAKELRAAGHKLYATQTINNWKRWEKWDENLSKPVADASEDVRHALSVVRVPEDLALVEQASIKLYAVGIAAADHLMSKLKDIEVKTPAEFEQYARGMASLVTTHFEIGKGLEELARRRIGSFSDGGAEITPPQAKSTGPTQADVVRKFAEARASA